MSPAQGKNQAWVTDWKSRLELQIGNQGRGVTTEAMRPTGILQKSSNRKERKSRLGLGQRRRRGAASEMGNQKDVLLQTYWEHLGGSIWWSPHVKGAKDRKLTSGSYKMKGAYPPHTHTNKVRTENKTSSRKRNVAIWEEWKMETSLWFPWEPADLPTIHTATFLKGSETNWSHLAFFKVPLC